jgi:hypothetical protein
MVDLSFFTSWSWLRMCMYLAVYCEEKLEVREAHVPLEVVA